MNTSHYPEGENPLPQATEHLEKTPGTREADPLEETPETREADPPHETPAARPLSRPKGPSWSTVALGLICLVVAGAVLFVELTDTAINWASTGPLALVGMGLLLVLVGLAALASRSDDDQD